LQAAKEKIRGAPRSPIKRRYQKVPNLVQGRLLGLELLAGLKKLELPGVDMTQAKQFARSGMKAVQEGIFGYSLIIASRTFGQEASR
jgi:hypothetical protein